MQSFLNNVVKDVVSKSENISDLTFILPSKRAGIFLKNVIKSSLHQTTILPEIISIEEFIEELANINSIDTITLIFEFYTIYQKTTPKDKIEPFDDFSKWGPLLLQDFNEIDRHLIDPSYIFSYLTDVKRLEELLKGEQKTDLILNQIQFYEKFEDYYNSLYSHLLKNNVGYQGLQYREATKNIQRYINNTDKKIVLVGFNALNKSEETLFEKLLDSGLATIYWDIDTFFYNNNHNASTFIKKYEKKWNYFNNHPFTWISDTFSSKKNIEIIGTPKDISQVKYAGEILNKIKNSTENFTDTALVLADESLLIASLNSLPKSVENVNITMGYDLKNIPLSNLFEQLLKLHIHNKKDAFYYKEVLAILNHFVFKSVLKESTTINNLIYKIASNNYTYLTKLSILKLSNFDVELESVSFLFDNWQDNANTAIDNCLLFIDLILEKTEQNQLEKEYLYRFYTIFQQLSNLNKEFGYLKDIKILYQFYLNLIKNEKLSFKGEPLSGLQIMGVLETRVLDFKNLIITSVNEGILPSGKSDNSFIPYDIKREIGLPTYQEKDAIFSYHFFRLLQRAENIYLLYNTEADSYGSGEQSRFLTQLEIFKENEVKRFVVSPTVQKTNTKLKEILKNEFATNELKALAKKGFSASTLNNYILNPLEFYKQKIIRIKEIEEVEENIAANTLGTIIHKTLDAFYKPYIGKHITKEILSVMKSNIPTEVKRWFEIEFKNGNISTGKNLLVYNVAQQFIFNFLNQELDVIKQGHQLKIIALEQPLEITLDIEGLDFPVRFIGEADRIDTLNGVTRIIDYKTGKVEQKDLNIKDWNQLTSDYKKYNKSFQVLFYALLYTKSNTIDLDVHPLESGIISFKNLKSGFLKVNNTATSKEDLKKFTDELKQLILEIFDVNIPIKEKESPFTQW